LRVIRQPDGCGDRDGEAAERQDRTDHDRRDGGHPHMGTSGHSCGDERDPHERCNHADDDREFQPCPSERRGIDQADPPAHGERSEPHDQHGAYRPGCG
jgi:hypothetical protein